MFLCILGAGACVSRCVFINAGFSVFVWGVRFALCFVGVWRAFPLCFVSGSVGGAPVCRAVVRHSCRGVCSALLFCSVVSGCVCAALLRVPFLFGLYICFARGVRLALLCCICC